MGLWIIDILNCDLPNSLLFYVFFIWMSIIRMTATQFEVECSWNLCLQGTKLNENYMPNSILAYPFKFTYSFLLLLNFINQIIIIDQSVTTLTNELQ